jgi:replicative DNA helicase
MIKTATKTPVIPDRLPPHSPEAEQGVLGCVLMDPTNCLPQCIEGTPGCEVFYDLRHQTIYGAMLDLYDKRVPIDTINLMQHLKDAQQLDEIGGIAYLASLEGRVPSAVNLPSYL